MFAAAAAASIFGAGRIQQTRAWDFPPALRDPFPGFFSGVSIPAAALQSDLIAKLFATRKSPADLEVSGDVAGVPRGETRYLARGDLLAMSQALTVSPDDGNFKTEMEVKAVPLDDLARSLGAPPDDMIVAICNDGYRGHYPRAYRAAHHPVLVTELNGKALEQSQDDEGPYLIAHVYFKPAFRILAHSDEPQIPWGVIRLDFRNEKTVLSAIAPGGPHGGDPLVQDGYKIARQNCLRCHYNGDEGGLKSRVSWAILSALAANSPEFFAQYVRDPKSKNPKTQMAASPEYDDATMRALVAYFRTFAPKGAN